MNRYLGAILAALVSLSPLAAHAQVAVAAVTPPGVTGTISALTVTNTATAVAKYPGGYQVTLLAIDNESTTATIACAFGATTAATNTAGSFTMPPQTTRVWSSYPIPTEAMNCISSASSSPATIEIGH
jgi:hypothetical protein